MSLDKYKVARDKFALDDTASVFCFPCCACLHRKRSEHDNPCRTCDHNRNAVPDEKEIER